MSITASTPEIAVGNLVPPLIAEAKCLHELPSEKRDHLTRMVKDVAFTCDAALERQCNSGHLPPDEHTKHVLGLAQRTAYNLCSLYDDTSWWMRLLRLKGLVCAAEIIAASYFERENPDFYMSSALESAIDVARDYAMLLAVEANRPGSVSRMDTSISSVSALVNTETRCAAAVADSVEVLG